LSQILTTKDVSSSHFTHCTHFTLGSKGFLFLRAAGYFGGCRPTDLRPNAEATSGKAETTHQKSVALGPVVARPISLLIRLSFCLVQTRFLGYFALFFLEHPIIQL